MSIHLIGGGRAEDDQGEVYRTFLDEATVRGMESGREMPRVAVLLVGGGPNAAVQADWYRTLLKRAAPCDPVVIAVDEGGTVPASALTGIDALLIGGGHTPSYLEAVMPVIDEIRLLVADGLPYAGFSAGAAIASDRALIGGWQIGGIPVCPEDASEELDEVTVVEGFGLVDLAIEVHAAQWGTLSRLVAATEAGLVDGGVAIDEFTVLIVGDGDLRVEGAGSVWKVTPDDAGVLVGTLGIDEPGPDFPVS